MLQQQLKKKRPFDSPEQEAALNLSRTAGVLDNAAEQLFRAHGLSGACYNVLRILRGAGTEGLPSLEIRERLVSPLPDVTRLVDRLCASGLVRRQRTDADRRIVLVSIGQKGMDLLAKLDGPVIELHRKQLGHLTKQELSELNRLLEKARRD
ncbi:MAG: MarR family winged helix-turn-helix transcriptional regulator [Tepidisphaeraceae bacterium]